MCIRDRSTWGVLTTDCRFNMDVSPISPKVQLSDDSVEWWRPLPEDNFDVANKVLRTRCRPSYRKYLLCLREDREGTKQKECALLNQEFQKCVQMLKFLHVYRPEFRVPT
eukprot:TRINITY_DN695_c0_g1_i2.p1 TRINITY_DN695_c0_g1~~TRINITY_DN695_c0_g1_i2.p1  ORF type:complete len:110 (-),score=3.08 TRINITY_DN695_c0_g1_i2:48-377(-)